MVGGRKNDQNAPALALVARVPSTAKEALAVLPENLTALVRSGRCPQRGHRQAYSVYGERRRPSTDILEKSVLAFIPSSSAAPRGPETRPPLRSRAAMMASR